MIEVIMKDETTLNLIPATILIVINILECFFYTAFTYIAYMLSEISRNPLYGYYGPYNHMPAPEE